MGNGDRFVQVGPNDVGYKLGAKTLIPLFQKYIPSPNHSRAVGLADRTGKVGPGEVGCKQAKTLIPLFQKYIPRTSPCLGSG